MVEMESMTHRRDHSKITSSFQKKYSIESLKIQKYTFMTSYFWGKLTYKDSKMILTQTKH